MKCFRHPASDAIASCKHCCKGTCEICAIDTGHGVACSQACSAELVQLASLMKASVAATNINRGSAAYLWPLFLCVLGLAFVAEALLSRRPAGFGLLMGVVFVLFGLVLGAIQYAWRKRSGPDRAPDPATSPTRR